MKLINHLSLLRKRPIFFINDDKDLYSITDELKQKGEIGIDTEFIWRNTYYPILSLLQLATNQNIYLFDAKSLKDLSMLNEIFCDERISKVFHSARSDISVLNINLNSKFNNIFDTQLAYSLTKDSLSQISYKDLVSKYFYINLAKEQTNSDWNKRPLSQNQISYAINDVKFLLKISKIQKKEILKKNLTTKFLTQCKEDILAGQTKIKDARLSRFLKKKKGLSSVDKDLFLWRESEAERLNLPPNHIFKDKFFKRLKKIIQEKAFRDCDWIFTEQEIKLNFLQRFR